MLFLWIFGALNLLSGAGYFLFSGVFGVGDWQNVIADVPYYWALRVLMTVLVRRCMWQSCGGIGRASHRFISSRREYNTLGRLAYSAACATDIVACALDPMGVKTAVDLDDPGGLWRILGVAVGGYLLLKIRMKKPLVVQPSHWLWVAAPVIAGLFIGVLGRGIEFGRQWARFQLGYSDDPGRRSPHRTLCATF